MASKGLANMAMDELNSYQADLSKELNKVQRLLREQKIASHRFEGKNTVSKKDKQRITDLQQQQEEISAKYEQVSFCLRSRQMHGE